MHTLCHPLEGLFWFYKSTGYQGGCTTVACKGHRFETEWGNKDYLNIAEQQGHFFNILITILEFQIWSEHSQAGTTALFQDYPCVKVSNLFYLLYILFRLNVRLINLNTTAQQFVSGVRDLQRCTFYNPRQNQSGTARPLNNLFQGVQEVWATYVQRDHPAGNHMSWTKDESYKVINVTKRITEVLKWLSFRTISYSAVSHNVLHKQSKSIRRWRK